MIGDLVPILYLSMLEAPFAIIGLCGPSIHQLVQRTLHFGLRSLFDTRRYATPLLDDPSTPRRKDRTTSDSKTPSDPGHHEGRVGNATFRDKFDSENGSFHPNERLVWSSAANRSMEGAALSEAIPMGSITVKKEVSMAEHHERELI